MQGGGGQGNGHREGKLAVLRSHTLLLTAGVRSPPPPSWFVSSLQTLA